VQFLQSRWNDPYTDFRGIKYVHDRQDIVLQANWAETDEESIPVLVNPAPKQKTPVDEI
jgi:hypothetical protein